LKKHNTIPGSDAVPRKDKFIVEKKDNIAWLTFNQPKKRNAMDMDFFKELKEHFKAFSKTDSIRAVVIKAAGKSFTAGTDLAAAMSMIEGSTENDRHALLQKIRSLQDSVQTIEDCSKPVIAAVHGHCIGGGIDLICACDIRLAEQSTLFSVRETRMGIIADLGTLQRLPRIIGDGHSRDLAFTGRDFYAPEAFRLGLISQVLEGRSNLYSEAEAVARQVADNPPLTVQGVKEVINYSRDSDVEASLRYTAQKSVPALLTEDFREAIRAFKEKRKPRFTGK
jgi:enoyl-CoA hydratase